MKMAKMYFELGDLLNARGYIRRHGRIKSIEVGRNLLNQPRFRTVRFADGYEATFCLGHYDQWFRNDGKAIARTLAEQNS